LHLCDRDIDFDNLVLKVFGKGQKERFVPFSPELRRRVYRYQQWKQRKGTVGESLFTGLEGSRWEKRNSTTSLYALQDHLKLPRFGWHRLRNTFATNYLRHGVTSSASRSCSDIRRSRRRSATCTSSRRLSMPHTRGCRF